MLGKISHYRIFSLASLPFFANHPPSDFHHRQRSNNRLFQEACSTRGNKVLTSYTRSEHVIESRNDRSSPSFLPSIPQDVKMLEGGGSHPCRGTSEWIIRSIDRAGIDPMTRRWLSPPLWCVAKPGTPVYISVVWRNPAFILGWVTRDPITADVEIRRETHTHTGVFPWRASVRRCTRCGDVVHHGGSQQSRPSVGGDLPARRIAGKYAVVGRNRIGG